MFRDDGTVIMKVDNTTQLNVGQNRNSYVNASFIQLILISPLKVSESSPRRRYTSGLFIADIYSMPHGCSVWPAFWLVGEIGQKEEKST